VSPFLIHFFANCNDSVADYLESRRRRHAVGDLQASSVVVLSLPTGGALAYDKVLNLHIPALALLVSGFFSHKQHFFSGVNLAT